MKESYTILPVSRPVGGILADCNRTVETTKSTTLLSAFTVLRPSGTIKNHYQTRFQVQGKCSIDYNGRE